MKFIILLLVVTTSFSKVDKELWNAANNPTRLGIEYQTRIYKYSNNFNDLKLEGFLNDTPWTGDYWPTYKGGITYRWNDMDYGWNDQKRYSYEKLTIEEIKNKDLSTLSPAEKYDIFLGNYDFPLLEYERKRTNILKTVEDSPFYEDGYEIPRWEGLCHGWAPATILFKNPSPFSIKNDDGIEIEFGSADMKALLTYHMHYNNRVQTYFLGKRCNLDFAELHSRYFQGEITEEEYLAALESSECRDVNAGAFHVVLTNQIMKLDEGFIVDVTRDQEVWNQPVFAYRSEVLAEIEPTEEQKKYGTHKVIKIETQMDYVVEMTSAWDLIIDHRSWSTAYYSYNIELDKKDNIIGGEWISHDRPDFMWKQERPEFQRYFLRLKELYEKSIDY